VAVDLSAPDGPAQLIRHATEKHGQLDVLVNNVGAVRMRTEGFLGTSDEDFALADADELLYRPARQPGRPGRDGRTRQRRHRQRRLGQRQPGPLLTATLVAGT